jgi:glucose dehydrogenase
MQASPEGVAHLQAELRETRWSLKQIDTTNVKRLGLAWTYEIGREAATGSNATGFQWCVVASPTGHCIAVDAHWKGTLALIRR